MDRQASPLPEDSWISILRDGVTFQDLNDKTLKSLIRHLADLKILAPAGGHLFELPEQEDKGHAGTPAETLRSRIMEKCGTEEGFALAYFLKEFPRESLPPEGKADAAGPEGRLADGIVSREGRILSKRTSNLSNLQIVRKLGRQLSPFIEMETRFLNRLLGTHTTKQDARNLFNFIVSRIQEKGVPRPWEQLSRRKHK
ncbi:MAG: hypothetical protein ACE5ER_04085 [Nitrospinaceae bacterium]